MARQKAITLQQKKDEIQDMGLDKIKGYFGLDNKELSTIKPEVLKHLFNAARLGMQFEREMNISKRSTDMNYIRIAKIVSDNKAEMKSYLKKTLNPYFL